MRGIILAAGRGARFAESNGSPKCLARLGGVTLIERQLQSLRAAGINDITVVVGFQDAMVRAVCGTGVRYLENAIFEHTDSLYSLSVARSAMTDGFVVLNSDVLFSPRLLNELLAAPHEDALLVHYVEDNQALGSEEMKVQVRGGRVVKISKLLAVSETDGENVGIAKFSPAGASVLRDEIDSLLLKGCWRSPAPHAFLEFAERRPLYAVGTGGLPWIEIDFPEDYRRAVNEVLPKIDRLKTTSISYSGA